jgi:hypothetical protein
VTNARVRGNAGGQKSKKRNNHGCFFYSRIFLIYFGILQLKKLIDVFHNYFPAIRCPKRAVRSPKQATDCPRRGAFLPGLIRLWYARCPRRDQGRAGIPALTA